MDDYAIKRNINRVYSRMEKCKQNDSSLEKLCRYKTVSINGIELYNYNYILQNVLNSQVYLKKISPIVATLTHDDLTIENLIVGNGQYVLVDPRGVLDTGYYRDYIYDIAKFTCTLSGFTAIKYGNFETTIERNSITYRLSNTVQNKYDKYSNNDGGIKIDLNKNFRSRDEVVKNINLIFNSIMDDKIGGANYSNSHQMIFGNQSYNKKGKTPCEYCSYKAKVQLV